MRNRYRLLLLITGTLLWGLRTEGHADTVTLLHQAAQRYDVPNSLLLAIAYVESRGVLTALNIDGTSVFPQTWEEGRQLVDRHARENLDVGLMQVNVPTWSPRLGLEPATLYQPHVNLPAAAYVLRRCIDESGGELWKGVGCYHSQRVGHQKTYVTRVWAAYGLLRRRGIFGPMLAPTEVEEGDPGREVLPVGLNTRATSSTRGRGGRYQTITPPSARWRPSRSEFPPCPAHPPQMRVATGTARVTLVFFAPGQAWPDLGSAERTLVLGMCVGCRAADASALSEAISQPVHVADPGLPRQLDVSCLPTVVRLLPDTVRTQGETLP